MRTPARPRVRMAGLALLIALAITVAAVAVLAVEVHGPSMRPTLRDGDRVLLRPFSGGRTPQRLALVVARLTANGPAVVKRVVAVGGDRVEIRPDGAVRVQPGGTGPWFVLDVPGRAAGETSACCAPDGRATRGGPVAVPAGSLFLLGDDAESSTDSRETGWASIRLVRGSVWVRVHPPSRWGTPQGAALRPAE